MGVASDRGLDLPLKTSIDNLATEFLFPDGIVAESDFTYMWKLILYCKAHREVHAIPFRVQLEEQHAEDINNTFVLTKSFRAGFIALQEVMKGISFIEGFSTENDWYRLSLIVK